ncbi:hypothetical protein Tco_0179303, partial [Tanacetum coccineum]
DGIVDVDETILERVLKFKYEIQFSLKLMNEMEQVGARTDKQDDDVKNQELCATVLDQNNVSNMITSDQTQDDLEMIVTSITEPCVSNQNLEIEGRPQDDDEKMIEPKSFVDLDLRDIQRHDTEEPQKETKEDDPSQEDVENPEGLSDEQSPPKVVDTVRDPESSVDAESNKRDQEYDLQFPSLHQYEESTPQETLNDGGRS